MGKHVIVLEREQSFANAISRYLPNLEHVFCWNHIRRDIRTWLSSRNASADDKTVYGNDLFQLQQSESFEAFTELEAALKLRWS